MAKKTKAENKSTALVPWEAEMAEAAAKGAAAEKPSGGFKSINVKNGRMFIDDNPVDGDEIEVVVLASLHENLYYGTDYDPDVKQSPKCYAFSDKSLPPEEQEDAMKPHEEAPEKQSDACAGCPMNEFGSADRGKGKACSNVRRLAVISAEDAEDAESLEAAEVRSMKISVTSVKNWSTYIRNKVAELSRPSYGVVTKIRVVPDPKSQHKLLFSFVKLVDFDAELYEAMKKKVAQTERDMVQPYPVFEAEPEEKPKGKKGKAAKVALPQAGKAKATRRKF